MTINCASCNQPLLVGTIQHTLAALKRYEKLTPKGNRSRSYYNPTGWAFWGQQIDGAVLDVPELGSVTVHRPERIGEDDERHMVFEIGDKFYRISRDDDSYGSGDWDESGFREVKMKTRTATYFE